MAICVSMNISIRTLCVSLTVSIDDGIAIVKMPENLIKFDSQNQDCIVLPSVLLFKANVSKFRDLIILIIQNRTFVDPKTKMGILTRRSIKV